MYFINQANIQFNFYHKNYLGFLLKQLLDSIFLPLKIFDSTENLKI